MKKKHFLFIPIITMGIFAISCTNTFDEQFVQEDQQMPTTKSMGDGQYQVLGCGYDITGEYLARQSIKNEVLDIAGFYAKNPQLYKVEYVGEIKDNFYAGEDYMNYVKDIINKTNFSGSVAAKINPKKDGATSTDTSNKEVPYSLSANVSFDKESSNKTSITTKETYIRVDQIKQLERYQLYADPTVLADYLTPYFKSRLSTASPDAIIEEFGTHILIDFNVGGRLSIFYKSTITDNLKVESKTKIAKGGITGAIKTVNLSFSGSSTTTEVEQYQRRNSNWSCNVNMYGGQHDGHTITITSDGATNHTFNLSGWQQSVDKTHCVLTEINFNKTYPIYEFIKDPIKKQQIKDAAEKYIKSKIRPIIEVKPMFQIKSPHTKDNWWVFSQDDVNYINQVSGDYLTDFLGFVLVEPAPNTKPMHRLKSIHTKDTWYAFSYADVEYAKKKWNEQYYGIDGYVYADEQPNTVPLHHLKSTHTKDTWYTNSYATVEYAKAKWGEQYFGIDGYIIKP